MGLLSSIISGAFGMSEALINANLTATENAKNREFNSSESATNRQFQHDEAMSARAWQESFYNNYQSPSAMMSQYKDAGLNPALLYGGASGGSVPSTSTPSGSAATVSNVAPKLQLIEPLIAIASAITEIKNRNKEVAADVALKETQARDLESGINKKETEIEAIKANVANQTREIDAKIANLNSSTDLNKSQIDKITNETAAIAADRQLKIAQTIKTRVDTELAKSSLKGQDLENERNAKYNEYWQEMNMIAIGVDENGIYHELQKGKDKSFNISYTGAGKISAGLFGTGVSASSSLTAGYNGVWRNNETNGDSVKIVRTILLTPEEVRQWKERGVIVGKLDFQK